MKRFVACKHCKHGWLLHTFTKCLLAWSWWDWLYTCDGSIPMQCQGRHHPAGNAILAHLYTYGYRNWGANVWVVQWQQGCCVMSKKMPCHQATTFFKACELFRTGSHGFKAKPICTSPLANLFAPLCANGLVAKLCCNLSPLPGWLPWLGANWPNFALLVNRKPPYPGCKHIWCSHMGHLQVVHHGILCWKLGQMVWKPVAWEQLWLWLWPGPLAWQPLFLYPAIHLWWSWTVKIVQINVCWFSCVK